jgi:uncharacterized membrane protein required for colicin V production
MADGIFALILFYSFIAGARRGFYKEVVQTLALILSISFTRGFYEAAGERLAATSGMPVMLGHVVGGCVLWVVSFFVAAVVGRLILKKIRGKGVDDALGEGAEAVADALGGDTTKGPVTLLTDPIATKTGLFYWSDKILGSGLGLLKGIATGYVLFGMAVYADRAKGWNSYFVNSIEESYAAEGYQVLIEPYLATFPEYKIVASLTHMKELVELIKAEPWRFAAFATHNELRGISQHPRVQELAKDEAILKAWRAGKLSSLFFDEKVRALLTDASFRDAVGTVNWAKVRDDTQTADKASCLQKLIPDGKGGTFKQTVSD